MKFEIYPKYQDLKHQGDPVLPLFLSRPCFIILSQTVCGENSKVFRGRSCGHLLSYKRSHFQGWLDSEESWGIFCVCFWSTVLSFLKNGTSFLKPHPLGPQPACSFSAKMECWATPSSDCPASWVPRPPPSGLPGGGVCFLEANPSPVPRILSPPTALRALSSQFPPPVFSLFTITI